MTASVQNKTTKFPTNAELRAALKELHNATSVANDDESVARVFDAANDLKELREARVTWATADIALRRKIDSALAEGVLFTPLG